MNSFACIGTVLLPVSLLACSNTVSLAGQGGSTGSTTSSKTTNATTGQTSTTQTVTGQTGATTGQTGTTSQSGTTNATSTGTAMVNPHCTDVCNKGDQLSMQLGCAPSGSGCASSCEQIYTMDPQCSSQVDAFFNCLVQQANAQTCQCDPSSMNQLKCGSICTSETQAVSMCVQAG